MVRRRRTANAASLLSLVFASYLSVARAQDDSCRVEVDGMKYDLTALAGEHSVSRTRDTPPTSMEDTVRFNLCGELNALDGVDEADQCPSGTTACLTKTNKKGSESDRVVAVIPVAQTSEPKPDYSILSSPKGLSMIMHGASYPSSSSADPIPQSFNLSLLCSTDMSDATLKSYDGSQVRVEWSAPAGCGFQGDEEPPTNGGGDEGGDRDGEKDDSQQSVGSGIGWFFLVLLLVFVGYFILGAYYNYSTYGATGADLIPHRDFWREVPYMLRDVVSHLCSSFRPRRSSSRGGYIAV